MDHVHVSDDEYYSDDVYDYDVDLDDTTMKSFGEKEKNYNVLSEYDILQRQEDSITEISNVLCVSRGAASILLRAYNWSVSKVHEAWFADEEQIRKTVGLLENTPIIQFDGNCSNLESIKGCKICSKQFVCEKVHDVGCGHSFCSLCWKGYITESIESGDGCLDLRCPDPSCSVPVGHDLIKKIVSGKDRVTYLRYLVRSYIEGNHKIKLCPEVCCGCAVEYKYKVSCRGNFDVTCVCTHSFCWKCMEEAHSPVDCDTAAKWLSSDDAKSLNWIMANCKLCPECRQPIESKDDQKLRMTCRCGFTFCWLCFSPWIGFTFDHKCNLEGRGEEEKRRNLAKSLHDRYTHCYGKWAANETFRQMAKINLWEVQALCTENSKVVQGMTISQLSFIPEAWQLIIECRSVLKWTYAYSYYLPEGEARSQLSEYLQSEAESCLERLQHCAEDMLVHFHGCGPDFIVCFEKLSNLTNVTQDLFTKLAQELEKGRLVDEGSHGDCTNTGICLVDEGSHGDCTNTGISLTESFIDPLPLIGPK